MPKLSFSRTVPHSPDQMLALVADVERYPEFVPNCTKMDVQRDADAPDRLFDARMHVSFGPIKQAYTSRVSVDHERGAVEAKAIDGPFRHLWSEWTFAAQGEGTRVTFDVDFAIRNPLLAAAAEPAFESVQAQVVDAFMKRASTLYG